MKSLVSSLSLDGLIGALLLAATFALPPPAQLASSARLGICVAFLVGIAALVMKGRPSMHAQKALAPVLRAQVASLLMRVVALGLGTIACVRIGVSPNGYIFGFLAMYIVQQFVEVRYQLALHAKQKGLTP